MHADECRDIESPCSELMAQLEQLSIEQSGPSRDAVNEPQIKGSDDFAAGSAGGAQGHFLAESHVKKDPGGSMCVCERLVTTFRVSRKLMCKNNSFISILFSFVIPLFFFIMCRFEENQFLWSIRELASCACR